MSADVLRRAAALMRERAEAADTYESWVVTDHEDEFTSPWCVVSAHEPGDRTHVCRSGRDFAPHIASWHPAVALAVADWLESAICSEKVMHSAALVVARAYLGVRS